MAAATGSSDATLSALSLSGIDIGTFDPATTEYTASVDNDVTETIVSATTAGSGASSVVKLGGVEDADRTVDLAVGDNAISVVVTAEDGQTTRTYTVTVTRAEAETPLTAEFQEAPATHNCTDPFHLPHRLQRGYLHQLRGRQRPRPGGDGRLSRRSLAGGPAQRPVGNKGTARRRRGDSSLCGPGLRHAGAVCASDGKVLSNRPELTIPGPTPVNSPASGAPSISGTARVGQTLTASTSGIADADGLSNAAFSYQWVSNDGTTDTYITGATAATYTLVDADAGKTIKVRVTFTDDGGNEESLTSVATATVSPPPSDDATLSGLSLSGVNIGTFDPATTGYTASVGNDVTETTVTPTANDGGATYVVKLDGVEDADRTVNLVVGKNAISVVVTAEDGQTTRAYTVTVTRAEAEAEEETETDRPLAAPDTPTGEVTGKGQVKLDWNDVAGAAYYQVRTWINEKWVELPAGEIGIVLDGSGATVSNLPNYGFLYFSVRAGNAAGVSEWSEVLSLANPER